MKKIMIGVGLGLAGMSQAHAWNGGIEDMRTMQDNTSGQVVRVKSSTTDCCTLRPMNSHGHQHQHKMVHNGQVYYCTRVAGHGQQVSRHPAQVKQHYRQQTQQAVNAQRAKRQAMYAAKAKQKALLLAQQRKRAQMLEAQKRKAVLLAQQKQRAAHQALIQAQQRKRAIQLQQQKRKLQLLAQQRRQAAQRQQQIRVAAVQQQRQHYQAPQKQVVHVQPQRQYYQAPQRQIVQVWPQYQSSYQMYHYEQPAPAPRVSVQQSVRHHDSRWQRSPSVRMQSIQRVIKKEQHVQRPVRSFSAQQSVAHHDAVMAQRRHVAQVRAAQLAAQKKRQHIRMQQPRYVPVQQSVVRHDARALNHNNGWQRGAQVQSHGVRVHKQQIAAVNTRRHEPDCGC
ncbi:MAG: hypothetical protein R3F02_04010 [Thiolinea sp.]